eukprot:COSAG06_NODE_846_length_11978_cov_4.785420_9_plen_173_part_00
MACVNRSTTAERWPSAGARPASSAQLRFWQKKSKRVSPQLRVGQISADAPRSRLMMGGRRGSTSRWHLAATGTPRSEPPKSRTFCVRRRQKRGRSGGFRGADAPADCSSSPETTTRSLPKTPTSQVPTGGWRGQQPRQAARGPRRVGRPPALRVRCRGAARAETGILPRSGL